MKYVVYALNIFLFLMVPVYLFVFPLLDQSSETNLAVKELKSNEIVSVSNVLYRKENVDSSNQKEIVLNNDDKLAVNVCRANVTDVLETVLGKMSAYGPDCAGCGGKVGAGQVVTNGNIYYYDKVYGQLRIVAGDSKFQYGTVIRVLNSKYKDPFYAIVLDRGSDIGINRRFTFDLLFPSEREANLFGTSYNVTFEVVRYGY